MNVMFDQAQYLTRAAHSPSASVKRLTMQDLTVNTSDVPDKEGTGFGDLTIQSAQAAQRGFFYACTHFVRPSMGGSSGEAFGLAGGFGCRFANPAICRSPRLATGSGVTTPKEAQP